MNPVWESIFAAIPDVSAWNQNMPRLVQDNGPEFKASAQAEAAKRGYMWSRESRCYVSPWTLKVPNHGTRLLGVGWRDGILRTLWVTENKTRRVRIKSFYEHGSPENRVPEETAQKLCRGLYPENLFNQIVKDKFPSRQTDKLEESL